MRDVNYFINKFESIPDDQWITGELYDANTGACCALGHCGVREGLDDWNITDEAKELSQAMFGAVDISNVYDVNDDENNRCWPGATPKERILNQLYLKRAEAQNV